MIRRILGGLGRIQGGLSEEKGAVGVANKVAVEAEHEKLGSSLAFGMKLC